MVLAAGVAWVAGIVSGEGRENGPLVVTDKGALGGVGSRLREAERVVVAPLGAGVAVSEGRRATVVGVLVDSLEDGVRLANWVAAWVIWGAEEPAFAGVSEERDAVGK